MVRSTRIVYSFDLVFVVSPKKLGGPEGGPERVPGFVYTRREIEFISTF